MTSFQEHLYLIEKEYNEIVEMYAKLYAENNKLMTVVKAAKSLWDAYANLGEVERGMREDIYAGHPLLKLGSALKKLEQE